MRCLAFVMALSFTSLAAGCGGNFRSPSSSTAFDENDQSAIIVLRVSPKNYVVLAKGIVEGDGWRMKGVDEMQFWSEDGFVVARVRPTEEGEAYGIITLRPDVYTDVADEPAPTYATARWPQLRHLVGAQGYFPDTHVHLPAFTATAGRVTYVGAIRIDASTRRGSTEPPKKISVTPVTAPADVALVTRYLAKHYPNIRGEVLRDPFRMLRRNEHLDFGYRK